MNADVDIQFSPYGKLVKNEAYRAFRTDYLLAMTKIQKRFERDMERIRKKYQLTEEQMENLINTI